ncbi:MAG TPA: NAD(P)-dependent oxidoreductase [Alcaligenes sp.]|nr:NAD(P)-dependent oxidoreductase [Alcaligenes sp.]HRL28127.1 NAD(P)-dependent oxidoreductase [Alcaligenes sp.]
MNLFPLFFNLTGRAVMVVGGGMVAERKVRLLLRAGADVTVVAPQQTPWLVASAQAGVLRSIVACFSPAQLGPCCLVVAATGRRNVNQVVAEIAHQRCIPCNVVDDAQLSSVQVPAIVDRSPLMVAVSSAGSAPVLARRVRERIESVLEESLGDLAALAASHRPDIKKAFPDVRARRFFFDWLLGSQVQTLLASGQTDEAAAMLKSALRCGMQDKAVRVSIVCIADLPAADLLTLRALRVLNQADWVLYLPQTLPTILDKVRRDAGLQALDELGAVLQDDFLNPEFWGRLRPLWSNKERVVIVWRSDWDAQALVDVFRQMGVSCAII